MITISNIYCKLFQLFEKVYKVSDTHFIEILIHILIEMCILVNPTETALLCASKTTHLPSEGLLLALHRSSAVSLQRRLTVEPPTEFVGH